LALAPTPSSLSESELKETIRWLILKQDDLGFHGRTEKPADACYSFWCGAALDILGKNDLVDREGNAAFLASCQFKYGGIAKAPAEHSDPYHTYLSLASLAIYQPSPAENGTWRLEPLNARLNGKVSTIEWALEHIPRQRRQYPSAQFPV